MFDRNSVLAGAASVILGAVIAGAGVLYFADSPSRAEPSSFTQAEGDSMVAAMDDLSETQMAEIQMEPPVSQAERDFMDFTMPDLSKPKEGQDVTRHGCVKPNRPQWAIDLPRSEAQKSLLLTALYDAARYQAIIEDNSCSCETEYPSWDEADLQYQQITEGKDNTEIIELKRQEMRQVMDFQFDALAICSQSRGS